MAFSPDGTKIASGSDDEEVELWDVETGRHIKTLGEHGDEVRVVAFSPDGTKIVSLSLQAVKLWEVSTGQNIVSLKNQWADHVAFSPDSTILALGSRLAVNLLDVETGRIIVTLLGHGGFVADVAFSPDGTKLASGARDGTILLWDMSPYLTPITLSLQRPTVTETVLLQNYPNPFKPRTWIPYQLANDTDVQITIYDTKGTLVCRLNLGHQKAGFYTYQTKAAYWDGWNEIGESVAAGVYFYTLATDDYTATRKMVILR